MTSLTIIIDKRTQKSWDTLSATEGVAASEIAARLLRRAVRAARPRPVWNLEAIRTNAAEFEAEDGALADSDSEHKVALLAREDAD